MWVILPVIVLLIVSCFELVFENNSETLFCCQMDRFPFWLRRSSTPHRASELTLLRGWGRLSRFVRMLLSLGCFFDCFVSHFPNCFRYVSVVIFNRHQG